MGYVDDKEAQARAMVGKRVEIPVHYDLWMRGARFGQVVGLAWGNAGWGGLTPTKGNKVVKAVRVKMDHPQVKRHLKVWRIDFDYIKVLEG